MAVCLFFVNGSWQYTLYLLHDSNIWPEDTVHQLKINSNNIKAIFPASGGRVEMTVYGVFQSRCFLLILYRERQILKQIKFWLSLLLTRANG